jgi:hypothetical protein
MENFVAEVLLMAQKKGKNESLTKTKKIKRPK